MKREILLTSDGSTTIHIPDWNEQYHSKHGAIQEAEHVFLKMGLEFYVSKKLNNKSQEISILEIGFGTGLNAFMTYLKAAKNAFLINYIGIEAYPVASDEVQKMNYTQELKAETSSNVFEKMHNVSWDKKHNITSTFSLTKRKQFFEDISDKEVCNLIYFDAFGARNQPELWTESIFSKMYIALKKDGVLVTYAAKGSVRRAMQAVGFTVERLPGPPGKREMLRAIKN